MTLTLEEARRGYTNLWQDMSVLAGRKLSLKKLVEKLSAGRARYEAVEKETGVPWWFIAILHEREASCDFNAYLGNGELVIGEKAMQRGRKTRIVPKDRGPFATWEEGAIDALTHEGFVHLTDWSLSAALYRFEAYNGWGYYHHGVNSAYIWSWTSEYEGGKFVADGDFNRSAIDPQPGCAAMLRGLIDGGFVSLPAEPEPAPQNDAGAPDDPVTLDIGSRGEEVRQLQIKLRQLGYRPGLIDGSYGPNTADAVAAFQRRNALSDKTGAWHKSYDDVLASASSIIPDERANATPGTVDKLSDKASRTLRLMRNIAAYLSAAFGSLFAGKSVVPESLSNIMSATATWVHGHAWLMVIMLLVVIAIVAETFRLKRAKEYAAFDYQGPGKTQ